MTFNDKQIQIMEVAESLFAEKGFNGTSVRDIAEKAQVNLAMVSYYFGSKDKLFEALFNYRGEYVKLKLETIIADKSMTSMEKMNKLIEHYIEKIISQTCFSRIMAREQVMNQSGEIVEIIFQMKKRNQDLIAQLVHEGQKKGEFKKNIDIPLMMATMIGTGSSIVSTQHFYRRLNNLQDLTDDEFNAYIRKKLTIHLKKIFKEILLNDE